MYHCALYVSFIRDFREQKLTIHDGKIRLTTVFSSDSPFIRQTRRLPQDVIHINCYSALGRAGNWLGSLRDDFCHPYSSWWVVESERESKVWRVYE